MTITAGALVAADNTDSGQSSRTPKAGKLELQAGPDVFTIQYGGKAGLVGIPSWKVVIRRDDGGNISEMYVPADSPRPLSSGRAAWPLTILQATNRDGIDGTMTKGRESYGEFRVEQFEVVEESPARVVIRIGGPSPNRHFLHERTYTLTAAGVKIEGWVDPLLDLRQLVFDPHWARDQLADSHVNHLPMRTQGETSWLYMASSGSDAATPLPHRVHYPLEIELRLRRAGPTFVRLYIDEAFDAAVEKGVIIHNNKDQPHGRHGDKMAFEKLTGFGSGPVDQGDRQSFQVRFEFETQEWPTYPSAAPQS